MKILKIISKLNRNKIYKINRVLNELKYKILRYKPLKFVEKDDWFFENVNKTININFLCMNEISNISIEMGLHNFSDLFKTSQTILSELTNLLINSLINILESRKNYTFLESGVIKKKWFILSKLNNDQSKINLLNDSMNKKIYNIDFALNKIKNYDYSFLNKIKDIDFLFEWTKKLLYNQYTDIENNKYNLELKINRLNNINICNNREKISDILLKFKRDINNNKKTNYINFFSIDDIGFESYYNKVEKDLKDWMTDKYKDLFKNILKRIIELKLKKKSKSTQINEKLSFKKFTKTSNFKDEINKSIFKENKSINLGKFKKNNESSNNESKININNSNNNTNINIINSKNNDLLKEENIRNSKKISILNYEIKEKEEMIQFLKNKIANNKIKYQKKIKDINKNIDKINIEYLNDLNIIFYKLLTENDIKIDDFNLYTNNKHFNEKFNESKEQINFVNTKFFDHNKTVKNNENRLTYFNMWNLNKIKEALINKENNNKDITGNEKKEKKNLSKSHFINKSFKNKRRKTHLDTNDELNFNSNMNINSEIFQNNLKLLNNNNKRIEKNKKVTFSNINDFDFKKSNFKNIISTEKTKFNSNDNHEKDKNNISIKYIIDDFDINKNNKIIEKNLEIINNLNSFNISNDNLLYIKKKKINIENLNQNNEYYFIFKNKKNNFIIKSILEHFPKINLVKLNKMKIIPIYNTKKLYKNKTYRINKKFIRNKSIKNSTKLIKNYTYNLENEKINVIKLDEKINNNNLELFDNNNNLENFHNNNKLIYSNKNINISDNFKKNDQDYTDKYKFLSVMIKNGLNNNKNYKLNSINNISSINNITNKIKSLNYIKSNRKIKSLINEQNIKKDIELERGN